MKFKVWLVESYYSEGMTIIEADDRTHLDKILESDLDTSHIEFETKGERLEVQHIEQIDE